MWQNLHGGWFLAVNEFARSTPVRHAPMRLYAEYGVTLFAAVLLASWWWARRDRSPTRMAAALWAPAGALLAIGVNQPPVAALVMAFDRVYVGAHVPLDVIVDLLLGAAVTCLGHLAVRPILIWVVTWLTRTPLRPLLTATGLSPSR